MNSILSVALQGGVLILLVILARRAFRGRVSARLLYALWLLPLVRLLIPILPESRLGLWGIWQRAASPVSRAVHSPVMSTVPRAAVPVSVQQGAAPIASAAKTAAFSLSIQDMLLLVWALGALALAAIYLITNIRAARRLAKAPLLTDAGSFLPVRLLEGAPSPSLAGWLRPQIVLNRQALKSPALTALVIRHEETHFKHKDPLWAMLRALVHCLWWWHPLVWLMVAISRRDAETACDEAVIASLDADGRQAYGAALLALAGPAVMDRLTVLQTAMASPKAHLKERLTMIMNPAPARRVVAVCLVLMMLVLALPLSFAAETAPKDTPTQAPLPTPTQRVDGTSINEKEAIDIAKQTLLGRVVYDYGITGFDDKVKAERLTVNHNAVEREAYQVTVIAKAGHGDEELTAIVLADTGEVIRILQQDSVFWEPWEFPMLETGLNEAAWAVSPVYPGVSLCRAPDDYGVPMEQVYNGTPLILEGILKTVGGYPHDLFDDPKELWAVVTVGRTDSAPGATGYVPLVCLTRGDKAPDISPLTAKLVAPEGQDKVEILADSGLTDKVAGTFPAGAVVDMIGKTKDYYHVRADRVAGYVPHSALQFDDKTQEALRKAEPEWYDDIQPGWEKRYDDYSLARGKQYNAYGPIEEWTLAQRAEGTALAKAYGFSWIKDEQIVPGEGDLTQEEAQAKALKAITEKYGFTQDDIDKTGVAFYKDSEADNVKRWMFRYFMKPGFNDCRVILDEKGEPIDFWQADWVNRESEPETPAVPGEVLNFDSIDGYLVDRLPEGTPDDKDLTKEAAEAIARQLLKDSTPESAERSYTLARATFYRQGDKAWWLIMLDDSAPMYPGFVAAIHSPEGPQFYTQDLSGGIAEAKRVALFEQMVKEKGPWVTWSLADKAAQQPSYYGLPPAGAMKEDLALALAKEQMESLFKLDKAHVDQMKAFATYELDGFWRFDFIEPEAFEQGQMDGYVVKIHAVDGTPGDHWAPGGNG